MKKFLIIGNVNAISCKEIFPLIKDNKVWLGTQYVKEFVSDSGEIKKFGNILWYTNLEHNKRHSPITLTQKYSSDRYPKYDNYDAIEVSRTKDIPYDYDGVMGVPITFLDKYNPDQFEIVALGIVGSCEFTSNRRMEILDKNGKSTGKYTMNAKGTLYRDFNPQKDKTPAFRDEETGELYSSIYARVLIRRK